MYGDAAIWPWSVPRQSGFAFNEDETNSSNYKKRQCFCDDEGKMYGLNEFAT